jgi:hypothetical protein
LEEQMMRQTGILLCLLLVSGCAGFKPRPRPVETAPAVEPSAIPMNFGVTTGRIAVVNPQFRFVVVDFGGQRAPAIGATLKLYREDKPVGSVRLTTPVRGQFITADVVDGEPRVGDEVR